MLRNNPSSRTSIRLAQLSLVTTAFFTAVTAQYNAFLDLTDTYYPRSQNHSVYTCVNACINEIGAPSDCDLSSKTCWCSSPDSNLIAYACCFSDCTGTVHDATRHIGDWCSSVVSRPWEPPNCLNGAAQQTTTSPLSKKSYYSDDNENASLSSGAVAGLVIGLLWGFLGLMMWIGCCCARRPPEPAATYTGPVLPLHDVRPHRHEQTQPHQLAQPYELAQPRVQTPPPAYSEVPKNT